MTVPVVAACAYAESDASSVKSLSALVQKVLGSPLDKRQQLSNWEARPLSGNQMRYAAIDAWVLMRLMDKALFKTPQPPAPEPTA